MIPLDNKQLRWYRKDGKFELVSVDEAISRGLNKWEGWKCSAGVRALYIDYDGGVWVGNCASAAKDRYVDEEWEPYRIKKTEEKFGKYPYTDYIEKLTLKRVKEKFGEYPHADYIQSKIEEKFGEYPHTDYIESEKTKKIEKEFGKFPHDEYIKKLIDKTVEEPYPHTNFHYKYGDNSPMLMEKIVSRVNIVFSKRIHNAWVKYDEDVVKKFKTDMNKHNKFVKKTFDEEIRIFQDDSREEVIKNFEEEILKFQDDMFPSFLKSGLAYKNINLKKEKVWGYLGDIYKGVKYPKKWVTCPFNSCGCGSDVIISKFKTKDNIFSRNNEKLLKVTNAGYSGQSKTHDNFIDEVQNGVGIEMNFPIPYQILWDVSRRCNYDCSYCWPNVHNNTDNHFEKEVAFETSDKIIKWANGNEVRFNFGGGEPTLVPYFIEWMKYLKEKNQWTMVTTNGSMSNDFWRECVKYLNSINISAHFDSMANFPNRKKRFLRNIEIIMDYHDKVDGDHWLEIKLMTPPKKLDTALDFKKQIEDLDRLHKPGANGRMKGVCSLVPIRDIEDSTKIVDYNENELRYLQNQ
jgi:organic radical activating enzyme